MIHHPPRYRGLPTLATLLTAAATLTGAACNDPSSPEAAEPITELPRALSAIEREILDRSNEFAFSMADELLSESPSENLFYSPLSASMLLGMLLNGADGDTYTQMRDMLAFDGLTQEQINQGYADLMDLLVNLDPTVTVELGNSVWTRQGFPVLPDFYARVENSFLAEAEEVSFADPGTLDRINGWANDATNGRIETIFDALPANTVMVLLNAIYFNASWTTQFDPALTASAPFTRPDGSTVDADLMFQDTEIAMVQSGGATVFELPYGGEAFSMVVALPDGDSSVEDLVRDLAVEDWDAWLDDLAPRRAMLRLPRFELEWEKELNAALQSLGMTDAFGGGADFSRMTPGGGVYLSVVKQKSYVRVDEVGTEAAAVTGGVVVTSAPPEIRVDRPFLFALRERLTGTILFMGVINDPTG